MSLTDEEHATRRIGSSDAYIACGFEAFGRTPMWLYQRLRGEVERDDLDDVEWIVGGTLLEPVIAKLYEFHCSKREGFPVKVRRKMRRNGPGSIVSSKYPWMTCNPDYVRQGVRHGTRRAEKRIVECKAPGLWSAGWGEPGTDEVPDYVLWQVMHQMIVIGDYWRTTDVVRLNGNTVDVYTVRYDKAFAADIIEAERELWRRVENGDPPPPVTADDVQRRFPRDDGESSEAPPAVLDAIVELAAVKATMKAEKEREAELKRDITAAFGNASSLTDTGGNTVATWKRPKDSIETDYRAIFEALALRVSANPSIELDKLDLMELRNQHTNSKENSRRLLLK